MADLKLVGAVAVKVRPDTRGFLGETKRGVKQALATYNPDVRVDADVDVDTRRADQELERFERKHDGKTLKIHVRADYDSLRAAREQVAERLKAFDKHHELKFKADQAGLEKLRKQLDDLARKAKVEVNFVGDEAGYRSVLRKIERIRAERDLATTMSFKTDDESLKRAEAKAKRALARIENAKTVTINYSNDHASLQGAIRDVEQRIAKLSQVSLETRLNKTSLEAARAELRRQLKDAEYKVRFVRDEDGYRSVLAQIKKIRDEQHKTSEWKFKTDKASLAKAEKDALEALKKLEANRTIDIRYANDYDGLRAVQAQLDAEIAKAKMIKLTTKLDEKSLLEARAKVDAKLRNAEVHVTYNDDAEGYQAVLARIKQIQREKAAVKITFNTDDGSLEAERVRVQALLDATPHGVALKLKLDEAAKRKAEHEAKQLKDKIDGMRAAIEVGAHTGGAAAQLAYTSRSRIVDFYVKVNRKSLIVAEGLLKSLAGINTLNSAGRLLESLFVRFDKIALLTAGIATVIGSLVNVALYATSALLSIGGGIAQVVGLFATAPAIISALGSAVIVYIAAFKDFKGAIDGNAEAMGKLPPAAQAAATALQGVWTAIQKPVQKRFWDGMGTSIQDAVHRGLDPLKKGLADTGEAFGLLTAGALNSFTTIADNGQLESMFKNLAVGMKNLSGASEPFFDGFNKLGFEGSKFLPRFGTWTTELATTFDNWITRNRDAGKITEWIDHGVNSLENMWRVTGSTINIFKALTRAANDAGATGLAGFTIRMQNIADMMLSEPWQSQMSTVFEGARKGAGHLNEGFKTLARTMGNSAVWVGNLLDQFGRLGEGMLDSLSLVLGNKTFQRGTLSSLESMQKLLRDLGPAFMGLGTIIGNLSLIAGSVFGSIGQTLGALVGLLDQSVGIMLDNVLEVAPRLLGAVQSIITAITPTVLTLVTGLNGVLGFVNRMPAGVGIATAAFGAFLALRGLFTHFYKAFANTGVFKNMQGQWLAQEAAAGRVQTRFKMVNGELQKFTVPTERFSATRAAFDNTRTSLGNLATSFSTANAQMRVDGTGPLRAGLGALTQTAIPLARGALKGLMGALGGPWGLALMAAGIGVALFAQQQQKAKAQVESLTQAVDAQTGAFNKSGMEQIAKAWTDLDEAGSKWANFQRGAINGMRAGNETANMLKLSFADVTKTIADGGPAYEKLQADLDKLATTMLQPGSAEYVTNMEAAAGAFGLTTEAIQKMGLRSNDVRHLADNIREQANQAKIAKAVFEGLGTATGSTSIHAEKMAAAMQAIGDQSQTAATKIDAIRTALDLLKGGAQSAREAQVQAAKTSQAAVEQAKGLHDEIAEKVKAGGAIIQGTTGLIDQTSTTGVQLFEAMKTGADGVLIGAQAAYQAALEAKKTPEEAMAAAMAVVKTGQGELKKIADGAGMTVEQLQKEWSGFFGEDWELKAVFSASAQQFETVKTAVEAAGLKFDDTTFKAFLAANPDPAKLSIEDAKEWGADYATKIWTAKLQAMNPEALAAIAKAVGAGDAYKTGDYTAIMKAFNSTDPGVRSALQSILGVTNGNYAAAIKAFVDSYTAANAKAYLDSLAATRTAWIVASYTSDGSAPGHGRQTKNADGAINAPFSQFHGKVTAFANGGLSAKPTSAHIARAGSYVMYAEKETGGEAFIPLSASKRQRSVAIWEETGRRLGVQQFANGGLTGVTNSGGNRVSVAIDQYVQQTDSSVDDVARALMRQVKSRGVTTMEVF